MAVVSASREMVANYSLVLVAALWGRPPARRVVGICSGAPGSAILGLVRLCSICLVLDRSFSASFPSNVLST